MNRILALFALLATCSFAAQPSIVGAPRSNRTWLNSDPAGFSQLLWLAETVPLYYSTVLASEVSLSARIGTNTASIAALSAQAGSNTLAAAVAATNWQGYVQAYTNTFITGIETNETGGITAYSTTNIVFYLVR